MVLETLISNLVVEFSYLGIFVAAAIASATIIFPLPTYLIIIIGALSLKLNPILVSIMYSAGSMIGELSGWGAGVGCNKMLKKRGKLTKLVERYFKKHGFLTIFFVAITIFPFDIVSIIAASCRYDVRKWLLAGFLGKFLKTLILVKLAMMGLTHFDFLG